MSLKTKSKVRKKITDLIERGRQIESKVAEKNINELDITSTITFIKKTPDKDELPILETRKLEVLIPLTFHILFSYILSYYLLHVT